MSVFGSFTYGSDVYGPTSATSSDITDVHVIHKDKIRIGFNVDLVVNDALLDLSSYSIKLDNGVGSEIAFTRVVRPKGLVTDALFLITQPQTMGAQYTITLSNLPKKDGGLLSGSVSFISHRTKAANVLSVVHTSLDKSPESPVRAILEALTLEDERIGGARNDRL